MITNVLKLLIPETSAFDADTPLRCINTFTVSFFSLHEYEAMIGMIQKVLSITGLHKLRWFQTPFENAEVVPSVSLQ